MVAKILGYLLSAVGIIGLALSYKEVRTALNLTLPQALSETTLMIISLVVLAVGVLFVLKSGKGGKHKQRAMEVPIYHGKEIVGYRRV